MLFLMLKQMRLKTKYLILLTQIPNTALTAVENKIPDNSKYITTPEFNMLIVENFAAQAKESW